MAKTTKTQLDPTRMRTAGVSARLQRKCACGNHTIAGTQCGSCSNGNLPLRLQRSATNAQPVESAPPSLDEVLSSPGQPLDSQSLAFFGSRFGQDFSDVRVHTSSRAAESARSINALAYTAGRDIVFEEGQYSPRSTIGRQLLAHELTHVAQQKNGGALGDYALLASDSSAEREADRTARQIMDGGRPQLTQGISAFQIGRVSKGGDDQPATGKANPPATTPGTGAASGPQKQKLSFDILGADTELADFLTKAVGLSRNPDLRVTSLENMIDQLESKAPVNSNKCIEHVSIFNHGMPGFQALTGEGKKKVDPGSGTPGKLPRSGFRLSWLYDPANQAALGRLRKSFCCGASMHWLGCGTAGVIAPGGKRTEEELGDEHRYKEFGDRYQDEQDALKHGANLKNATFGLVNVQSWADATCTTIQASTDFVRWDVDNPRQFYKVAYGGEFRFVKPSGAGQCSCDPATGRIQGTWTPGQGIDYGDAKWQADLKAYNNAVKPASGSPTSAAIAQGILTLLSDVGPSLTVPSGLPVGPKVEPWINANSVDPNWVAFTYDHLVLAYPNDCWKWIGVNRMIIQQTPSYTRTTLEHELQHAADMNVAAFEYQLINGPPPQAPQGADKPGYTPTTADAYGTYVLDFRKYYRSGLSESRHLDIYATSAAQNYKRFAPDEKLAWFSALLSTVPPDIPASQPLSGEGLVAGSFQNPLAYEAAMRSDFESQLFRTTRDFIYNKPGQGKDPGKARTLLNHFGPVWVIQPADRAMLFKAMELEK